MMPAGRDGGMRPLARACLRVPYDEGAACRARKGNPDKGTRVLRMIQSPGAGGLAVGLVRAESRGGGLRFAGGVGFRAVHFR